MATWLGRAPSTCDRPDSGQDDATCSEDELDLLEVRWPSVTFIERMQTGVDYVGDGLISLFRGSDYVFNHEARCV